MSDFYRVLAVGSYQSKGYFCNRASAKNGFGNEGKDPPQTLFPVDPFSASSIDNFRFPMKPKSNYLGLAGDQKRLT